MKYHKARAVQILSFFNVCNFFFNISLKKQFEGHQRHKRFSSIRQNMDSLQLPTKD